jgi:hypothetical protein
MISAVLLLTIAAVDVVLGLAALGRTPRDAGAPLPGRVPAAAAALVVPLVGWLALATPPWWALAIAVCGLVWLGLESHFLRRRRHVPFLTAAVLAVPVVAVAVLVERPTLDDSPASAAFAGATGAAGFPAVSLSLVVASLATVLLLTRTANMVCRAAFGRALTTDAPVSAPVPRRWRVTVGSREVGAVSEAAAEAEATAPTAPALRGGRVIGPLERILIVALALVGAEAVIVGLLAAKGIVRFPEISADGRRGSKAEEFLIGSLVSWTIAGLMVAYLVVQRIS